MAETRLFTFRVKNANQINLAFAGLAGKLRDWRPIWPGIVQNAIIPWVVQQFETEGGMGAHGAWAPLSPRYAAWKEQHYPGMPILQREGRLRASLVESPVTEFRPTSMSYGTDVPYALFHQAGFRTRLGTSRSPKYKPAVGSLAHVPARRPIDPDERFKRSVVTEVTRGVARYARAVGFRIAGGDVSPSEAYSIGRQAIESGYA